MCYKLYFRINVKQNLKFKILYSFQLLQMCEFRGHQKLSLLINFGPIFSPLQNHNFLLSLKEGLKVHLIIKFWLLIKSDLNFIFSISFWHNLNFGLNFPFKLHFKQHLKVQISGVRHTRTAPKPRCRCLPKWVARRDSVLEVVIWGDI